MILLAILLTAQAIDPPLASRELREHCTPWYEENWTLIEQAEHWKFFRCPHGGCQDCLERRLAIQRQHRNDSGYKIGTQVNGYVWDGTYWRDAEGRLWRYSFLNSHYDPRWIWEDCSLNKLDGHAVANGVGMQSWFSAGGRPEWKDYHHMQFNQDRYGNREPLRSP